MRLVTDKVLTVYRQDPDKLSLFHKFAIPSGCKMMFTKYIAGHERKIRLNDMDLEAVRCFWIEDGETIVLYIARYDRSILINRIMWKHSLSIYEGALQFTHLFHNKENVNAKKIEDLWPSIVK